MNKLNVEIICDCPGDYSIGDKGFIDGYVTNKSSAYAVVVIGYDLVLVRLFHLKVIKG